MALIAGAGAMLMQTWAQGVLLVHGAPLRLFLPRVSRTALLQICPFAPAAGVLPFSPARSRQRTVRRAAFGTRTFVYEICIGADGRRYWPVSWGSE